MLRDFLKSVLPIIAGGVFLVQSDNVGADEPLVFISAFASGDDGAIHAYNFNSETGELKQIARTTDVENPFFLAVSPDNKFLYSIHAEKFGGKDDEQIAAYKLIGRTGKMKLLNWQSARGTASCYLDIDATGKTVVVANYSSGSVASLPVNEDGSLGKANSFVQHVGSSVNPIRQGEPHAHCFVISPDNKFAFAADLGLDQVLGYRLDSSSAKLKPNQQPFVKTLPGAGPRHLTFDPNGKNVYVINEIANSVTRFGYDAKSGALTKHQTISTLPENFEGTSYCADLKITPNGKFLYGTNRGHDSIAAYKIANDGKLSLISIEPSLGKGPQNLAITKDGKFLLCANMPGKNVVVFRINGKTGGLKSVGTPTEIPSPSCIMIR